MDQQLKMEDLQLGEGKEVVRGALITTHYTGWLEDGSQFDSSHDKGRPFQCVIGTGRVIKGWDIGLMGMRVGGKRSVIVTPELGFGDRGEQEIEPGATFELQIELLSVKR